MSNDPNGEKPDDESMKCLLARLDGALEDDPNPLQPSRTAQATAATTQLQSQIQSQASALNQLAPAQSASSLKQDETFSRPETQKVTESQAEAETQGVTEVQAYAYAVEQPVVPTPQAAQPDTQDHLERTAEPAEPALAVYCARVEPEQQQANVKLVAAPIEQSPATPITQATQNAPATQTMMADDVAVLSAASSMHTSAVEPVQETAMAAVPNPAENAATAFEAARSAVTNGSNSETAVAVSTDPAPAAVFVAAPSPSPTPGLGTVEASTSVAPPAMIAPEATSDVYAPTPSSATSTPAGSSASLLPGAAQRSPEQVNSDKSGKSDKSEKPNLQLVNSTVVATQSAPLNAAVQQSAPKWYHNNTHVAIAAALGGVVICAPLILLLGYKMGGGDASVIGTASEKIEEQRQMDHALEARMIPGYGLEPTHKKRQVMALFEDKEDGGQLVLGNVSPQLLARPRLVRRTADDVAEIPAQSFDHATPSAPTLRDTVPTRAPTAAVASLGEPDRKPIAQPNSAAPTAPRTPAAVAMLERPAVTAVPVPNGGETPPGNSAATTPAPTLVPPGDTLAKSASTAPASKTPVSKTLELDLGLSKPAPADVAQSEVAASSAAPAKPKEEKLHLPLAVLKPELTGKAGERIPLSLRFEPYALLPERSFVMISGLPDNVKLGGGVRRGPGIWLVNAPDVPDAVLELSKSGTGSFEIVANLIGPDGSEISNAKSRLIIEQFEKEAGKITVAPAAPVQAGISLSPFTAQFKASKTTELQKPGARALQMNEPVVDRAASPPPQQQNEAVQSTAKSTAVSEDSAVPATTRKGEPLSPAPIARPNTVIALANGASDDGGASPSSSAALTSSRATQPAPPVLPAQGYATSDLMEPVSSGPPRAPASTPSRVASSTASSGASSGTPGPETKPAARREDIAEPLVAPGITTGNIGAVSAPNDANMIYSPSNLMSEIVKPHHKIPQQLAAVLSKLAKRSSGPAISIPAATLTPLAETALASGVGISLTPSNSVSTPSAMASSNPLVAGNVSAKSDLQPVSAAISNSALRSSETIMAMMQPRPGQIQQIQAARKPAGSSQLAQQHFDEQPKLFIPQAELQALIDRGQKRIAIGDIALARLLFERAANGGSAQAAFALAETYDPNLIWRLGAVGLTGDIQKARFWYLQAQKLDSRMQIGERLRALMGL